METGRSVKVLTSGGCSGEGDVHIVLKIPRDDIGKVVEDLRAALAVSIVHAAYWARIDLHNCVVTDIDGRPVLQEVAEEEEE